MTPLIRPLLQADVGATSFLGEGNAIRFYAFGEAPQVGQLPRLPYAVWQMPTSVPENYLDRLPDADSARIQIDVYAESPIDARTAATAIRNALEPHAYLLNAAERGRDQSTRNYGYLLEFQFLTDRPPLP